MNYLDIEIYSNDLDQQITLREYFKKLLIQLWIDEECFDGKRPFGNSGWQYDVYSALISKGIIDGKFNEDGLFVWDDVHAQQFIIKLIKEL